MSNPAAQTVATELSRDQQDALAAVMRWFKEPGPQVFRLAGYAGTGKTEVVTRLGLPAQYAAFTGKAASVLRQRGAINAATLHSLLYGSPLVHQDANGREVLEWNRRGDGNWPYLIIADECGTIDEKLGRDLLATGSRILVTGDDYQLPPVHGRPFFGSSADFSLTAIHRQAAGSQPLKLATAIRSGEAVATVRFDIGVLRAADIVIVALNDTRRRLNFRIRREHGIETREPVVGDRVACRKNNRQTGVFNGTLWRIQDLSCDADFAYLVLTDEIATAAEAIVPMRCFLGGVYEAGSRLDVFDFGYALTCHAAQGSEWSSVVVIDETGTSGFEHMAKGSGLSVDEYQRRWFYTAATRAKSAVTIMAPPW